MEVILAIEKSCLNWKIGIRKDRGDKSLSYRKADFLE